MRLFLFATLLGAFVSTKGLGQTCGGWLDGYPLGGISESGEVFAMTLWDPDGAGPLGNHVVVAGAFVAIADTVASNIAIWDPVTDQWSALGSGTNGQVNALAVMPDNSLIVGGLFTACGTTTTSRVARWNGSQWSALLDTLGAEGVNGPGSFVSSLARLPDGRVVVGGSFAGAGDSAHSCLAAWSANTWTSLVPSGTQMAANEIVVALVVRASGELVIGGAFNNLGVVPVSNIGLWDGVGFQALGSGFNGTVHAVAVRNDSSIYAGGSFSLTGVTAVSNLARWNGSAWVAMNAGVDSTVTAIYVNPANQTEIYIGGTFTAAGAVSARSIVRTNQNGGFYTALGDGLHNDLLTLSTGPRVRAIVRAAPGVMLAAGRFSTTSGAQVRSIAKWNGATWTPIVPGMTARVVSLDIEPDGNVLLGGEFTNTPNGPASRVARWSNGGFAALGQGADNTVSAVKRTRDGRVFIAGLFQNVGGAPASGTAQFNGTTWNPVGLGFLGLAGPGRAAIAELAPGSPTGGLGDIFIGGEIDAIIPFVGALDLNLLSYDGAYLMLGAAWRHSSLPFGLGYVSALLPTDDGNLIVAGSFDWVDATFSVLPESIGLWKPGTQEGELLGTAFNANVHTIYALARLQNGDVVAGGNFSQASGAPGNGVARWNGTQWLPLGTGVSGTVLALTVASNGDLIAGGGISTAGGTPVNNIARWNGTSWAAMGDGVRSAVRALATRPNGEIVVGGDFARAGGKVSAYFARWRDGGAPAITGQPQSDSINCDIESPEFVVTIEPGFSPTYQWHFNGSPISAGDKYEITAIPNGSRLRINLLYLYDTDAGDYHVVVSTPCGTSTSDTASLAITGDCPPPCPADLNGDTLVDDTDFVLFAAAYDQLICNPPEEEPCAGDLNGDAFVDDADFVLFAGAYDSLLCP